MTKKPAPKKAAPKRLALSPLGSMDNYSNPRGDMHTLKEAEQIRAYPKRHAAAVNHAK